MGFTEILIILIIAVIILFGGKKITELARASGKVMTEFKKGKMEAEKELKELTKVEPEAEKKEGTSQ